MNDWFLSGSRNELLTHAAAMTDYEIAHDFDDCLLPVAKTPEDAAVLAAYAKARQMAPHFGPGRRGANNHDQVKSLTHGTNRKCEGCGQDFYASRSTARFCSSTCRSRLARVA